MAPTTDAELDVRFETLFEKVNEFRKKSWYSSALRVSQEIRRLARSEGRVGAYIDSTFDVMQCHNNSLDPAACQEAAVELIGLLESEERARSIQPDLTQEEYEWQVRRYSSCAYDNLAGATAELEGWNSDGVQTCVSEGISICHRTGNLQCVTCFRNYAPHVSQAADDLDLALHHSRSVLGTPPAGKRDQRWYAADQEIDVLLTRGQLAAAADRVDRLIELADTYMSRRNARLGSLITSTKIAYLLGEPDRWKDACAEELPPSGEFVSFDLGYAMLQGLIEALQGAYEAAIERLKKWDQTLQRRQAFDSWCNLRLRLLAVLRMAGRQQEFEKLSNQLREKARAAKSWNVMRCLQHLHQDDAVVVPIPLVANLDVGPYAPKRSASAVTPISPAEGQEGGAGSATFSGATATDELTSDTPSGTTDGTAHEGAAEEDSVTLPDELTQVLLQIQQIAQLDRESTEFAQASTKALDDLLAVTPAVTTDAVSASFALHLATFFLRFDCPPLAVWNWAQTIAAPYRQDARTLGMLALVGGMVCDSSDPDAQAAIDDREVERMFRESLDLDPDSPGNFERAGDYFYFKRNIGDAERCFARASRLDRQDGSLACKLANIYRRTDRERDALAVLDLSIREGSDTPEVFWEAGLLAYHLKQYAEAVAYLDGFEERQPHQAWTNYFRAGALIRLQRLAEAERAIEREEQLNPNCPYPQLIHRAAVSAGLKNPDQLQRDLSEVLAVPLSQVGYLTRRALAHLFELLWETACTLETNDAVRQQVEDLCLSSNLAPDILFEVARQSQPASENLNFYCCTVRQPLDGRWENFPGRLADEEAAEEYYATWGVLADSAEAAAELTSSWQSRCFPLPASVVEVQLLSEGYTDHAGIVWQGLRQDSWSPEAE